MIESLRAVFGSNLRRTSARRSQIGIWLAKSLFQEHLLPEGGTVVNGSQGGFQRGDNVTSAAYIRRLLTLERASTHLGYLLRKRPGIPVTACRAVVLGEQVLLADLVNGTDDEGTEVAAGVYATASSICGAGALTAPLTVPVRSRPCVAWSHRLRPPAQLLRRARAGPARRISPTPASPAG